MRNTIQFGRSVSLKFGDDKGDPVQDSLTTSRGDQNQETD